MGQLEKWLPSRKWWTQFVTSAATVITMAVTGDGINTDDETKAVIGIVVALALTYIVPNADTAK